uniref:SprT-like domain-containing protein Spartan (Trinotate prediction) n=1 Tax=Myxobolus squamalis TaxID=59785 RepID=A0A6B2FXT3_MYXSQ
MPSNEHENVRFILVVPNTNPREDSVIFVEEKINENKCVSDEFFPEFYDLKITDPTLEYLDPTPNIHQLFLKFDKDYFFSSLSSVEVKWSKQMTQCAGLCKYQPSTAYCVICLSQPLLQFRQRKDLVETLLHEMIHAFLFVTYKNTDHSAHGYNFISNMNRINKAASVNITVFHNFFNEVSFLKKHWWRCDGPCHNRPPYFGIIKRARNRAPGPNDFWWNDHKKSCSGRYIKIKEPAPDGLPKPNKKKPTKILKLDDYFEE